MLTSASRLGLSISRGYIYLPARVRGLQIMSAHSGPAAAPETESPSSEQAQTSGSSNPTGTNASSSRSNLAMQIILRRDLATDLGWPVGPLMAQAAHAATAVTHLYSSHPDVVTYLAGENGDGWKSMRKVVMECPNEEKLRELASKLDALEPRIPYHLWVEEPEGIPTALALVPNKRPKALKKAFDSTKCELWK